jgi:hypothetical protein
MITIAKGCKRIAAWFAISAIGIMGGFAQSNPPMTFNTAVVKTPPGFGGRSFNLSANAWYQSTSVGYSTYTAVTGSLSCVNRGMPYVAPTGDFTVTYQTVYAVVRLTMANGGQKPKP